MKIIINKTGSVPDENWMEFRKVRAIVKNQRNEYIISQEGGKVIFPGGKCDPNEDELSAIKRELKEETGLDFTDEELEQVLTLETYYDDFYDFRSSSIKPRHTITTYYYAETSKEIDLERLDLTNGEITQNFNIFFINKEGLLNLLSQDHSKAKNGKFFDEENRIILQKVLRHRNEDKK